MHHVDDLKEKQCLEAHKPEEVMEPTDKTRRRQTRSNKKKGDKISYEGD